MPAKEAGETARRSFMQWVGAHMTLSFTAALSRWKYTDACKHSSQHGSVLTVSHPRTPLCCCYCIGMVLYS